MPHAEPSCAADTKAWEVDTLRGHVNNVSSVLFHARQVCTVNPMYAQSVSEIDKGKLSCMHCISIQNLQQWQPCALQHHCCLP